MNEEQMRHLVKECGLDWRRGYMPLFDGDPTNRYAVLIEAVEEALKAAQPQQEPPKCGLGCTEVCKAKEHGCASECPALPWQPKAQPQQEPDDERSEDLYDQLHSLSKVLESSGRIDEHDTPDAYGTILDAMNFIRSKP